MPQSQDHWWELDMRDARRHGFFRGCIWGGTLSLPIWAGIAYLVKAFL